MSVSLSLARTPRSSLVRLSKKAAKRIIPVALAVYFVPVFFAVYVGLGLVDFIRNKRKSLSSLNRYFAGNGSFTWLLAPFNLLMDVLTLPYWNKGIYQLSDLPKPYQNEINAVIEAAHRGELVSRLQSKLEGKKRGMIFFKWYGKNLKTSIDIPEFHRQYQYVRTIGVSVFNTQQSTGLHYGPLRVTLRVLYNINDIDSRNAFIEVGNHINYWRENKLFIFDDTLEHKSCNRSEEVRYCLFVDVLRPSLFPRLMSAILACVRVAVARINFAFYKNWVFIK